MKFISKEKNLRGKIVLLRADLNSNYVRGRVLMSERIRETADTIKYLKKKRAKIVIIAHQGRPNRNDCVSMKNHARLLSVFTKVKFVDSLFTEPALRAIENLKEGGAILLENLRMYKEEYKLGKNKMVGNLSKWCDYYVNDAFSNSHRKHASMVSLPMEMKKNSYAGPLVEEELNALKKIKVKNALYILGGAKPKDDIKLLGKNKVLACGLFGQMCIISRGKNLGAQNKYLRKLVGDYRKILRKLRKKQNNVIVPVDFGVKVRRRRQDFNLSYFPNKYEIFDIGPATVELFLSEIRKASVIYMKGPVGDFSSKGFESGTFKILREIAKSKAFSLIGGGHLSDAINLAKINKNNFSHVSLSGGALLGYIAGEKLPGLEVLK